MIYATVNMTIGDYSSTCDKKILLYRGDKNVEIRFVMKGNKFTVLDSTYAQMIIKRPSAVSVFSEPALIQNDTVVLTITEDMIDELAEIGEYTFQIRLYDTDMTARATLPPCDSCLIIERPIAIEGEATINAAIINDSAIMPAAQTSEEEIFTEDDQYNKTIWMDGDLITDARMNKIEDALYYINRKGGTGGGGGTAPYISTELPETVMVGTGDDFDLFLDFTSPNMGKGTLKVFINDIESVSTRIDQGETTTMVPGSSFIKGTNRIVVYVLDRVGLMSNSLTFYVRYGSTELTSDFDAYAAYEYGEVVRYYFTPTALDTSLKLTFYMKIDGQEHQGVECFSDTRGYFTFPSNLTPDSHHCEAYVIDSNGVKSNVLTFNFIVLGENTIVVASDTKDISVEEGEQLVLDYKVYMKNNNSFITKTYIDDDLVNTGTCGLDFNYYRTSALTEGDHTIKIEVWDVTETYSDFIIWDVTVTPSTFAMLQPTNAGAMFIATAVNKSNSDERRNEFIGKDEEGNEIVGSMHGFGFDSDSGWVNDELIISGKSHVEIPIQPLANNARYGFTLDLEFTSRQIGVPDAEVLTLWDEEKNCGIRITTENLILRSAEGNECNLYYTDNERTNVMFIIDRQERKAKIYLNGVMCEAFHLSDYSIEGVSYLEDFTVNSNLILGGLNKNGYSKIRNLRIYNIALTTNEIINNWISCEIDKGKQRELVEFQNGNDLPTLYIYCDFSGLGKDDKKPCKIVYNSTDEEKYGKSFNLDHKESTCQYQGTSSMAYPIKNYRINLADENGDKWKYDFPGGQPEHRFTLKADFMNSCHAHNTGMAKFINDNLYNYKLNDEKSMNPFKWHHVQNGGNVNDFREAINGFPCRLILVNDGETPLNEGQNEPTPGNTKDMGIFNFNNDKDATATLGFDSDIFPNCASYEVTANSDTSAGAFMSYDGDDWDGELDYIKQSFELRYPDEDDVPNGWGFMGVEEEMYQIDYWLTTTGISTTIFRISDKVLEISGRTPSSVSCFDNQGNYLSSGRLENGVYLLDENTSSISITFSTPELIKFSINDKIYIFGNQVPEYSNKDAILLTDTNEKSGLKALIDWVDNCTDEEFVRDFEQHFHKDYTLRYYALVVLIGAVDNLGKNMMLDTADNKIFFPRFYDIDTILSYDNSGDIKFDVDIEMEQGYWNTSSSRLWTRIRELMHDDIVAIYNNMRQNGVSYDNIMKYMYGEQISKIPQKYYNQDYDIKYAPFEDSYIGMAHGNGYEHMKRWLKNRFIFCDTLFDYAPSYNNDVLTIRANTTEPMTIEIETYTPVYQHMSWYNGQMDKKKIDGKIAVEFTGTAMAATDQEVLIYGGSNIKAIRGISSMNPNQMLIGSATKIVELDLSNCTLLEDVNSNKANFSPHEYLTKLKLNGCSLLGGNLRINNCNLLQELDATGTAITGVIWPSRTNNLQKVIFRDCLELTTLDFKSVDTSNMSDMSNMFNGCGNLTSLDLSNFNTSNVADMTNMFYGCSKLTSLDLSNFDTSKVTAIPHMFNSCSSLLSLNLSGWDTKNLTDLNSTFYNCTKLKSIIGIGSWDTSTVRNMYALFASCQALTSLDISRWDTKNVTSMGSMFHNCSKLTSLDVSNFNTSKVTIMVNMFQGCSGLTSIDLSGWNTDNLVDVRNMFNSCDKLVSINLSGWNTSNISGISHMFYNTYGLRTLDMSGWNFHNITSTFSNIFYKSGVEVINLSGCKFGTTIPPINSAYGGTTMNIKEINVTSCDLTETTSVIELFKDCINLTDIIGIDTWDTSNVTDMGGMFQNCSSLTELDLSGFDTSKMTSMGGMFQNCSSLTSLDVSGFDTSNVAYMHYMFRNCSSLASLDLSGFDTGKVTNMNSMFDNCSNLTSLDVSNWDTSKVTNMEGLFNGCRSLSFIDVTNWNVEKVTAMSNMFNNCRSLPSLDLSKWNVANSTRFDNFMRNCESCKYLDISGWIIDNNDNIASMLLNCSGLEIVNVNNCSTNLLTGIVTQLPTKTAETPGYIGVSETTDELTASLTSKYWNVMNGMIVAEYTSTDETLRPVFNEGLEISDSHITTREDGSYSIMLATSEDFSSCSFQDATALTSVEYLKVTDRVTKMDSMFFGCENMTSINTIGWDTREVWDMSTVFYRCNGLTSLDLSTWNVEKVTLMGNMFGGGCNHLKSINLTDWKPKNVTHMGYMFSTCTQLESIDLSGWDTSSLTNISNLFTDCPAITSINLSGWDTGKVRDMHSAFNSCTNLTTIDLSGWDTKNTTEIYSMFQGCSKLTSLDLSGFDTRNVTSMSSLFKGCGRLTSLDLSSWNVDNATSMADMFNGCSNLTYLNIRGWNTGNVNNMYYMFTGCRNLTSLDLSSWDTKNVVYMGNMFDDCINLTSLDLSGWDISNVSVTSNFLRGCAKLDLINCSADTATKIADRLPTRTEASPGHIGITDATDELRTSLESKYWKVMDGVIVAKYTSTDANYVPEFNVGFTLTKNVIPLPGNLYSVIIAGSDDFISCTFTDASALTSIEYLKITSKTNTMLQLFHNCTNLTYVNTSNWNTENVTTMSYAFNNCGNLTSLDVLHFNTSSVKDMTAMFSLCSSLTDLDVSHFDIHNVTSLRNTFNGCKNVASLDVSEWDTSKVINMSNVFNGCTSLTSLDVSNWDTSNVSNMSYAFKDCDSLTSLDVSEWDTSKVTNISYMFGNCSNLTEIKGLNNWDTSDVITMVHLFYNCKSLNFLDISGWDVRNVTNMGGMFFGCNKLVSLDLSKWDTGNADNMAEMFYACTILTSLNLSAFDTGKATTMSYMFYNCNNLTSLNISNWDTSNVTNMAYMFSNCTKLTTLDLLHFNTSKVTNMQNMFAGCSTLTSLDLTNFNTRNVNNMVAMFYGCSKLTSLDVSNFDTKNVSSMTSMFNSCSSLTSLDLINWNVENVTSMASMFNNCMGLTSLELSSWNTLKLNDISSIFQNCSGLTSLDLSGWNTSAVTNMYSVFFGCDNLTSLDLTNFDTKNVTTMSTMFGNCSSLTSLDLTGCNIANLINAANVFVNCSKLTHLGSPAYIQISLSLAPTDLDARSLMDVIEHLITVDTPQTLALGAKLMSKLTEEQIAVAVNKGWTVA